MADIFCVAIVQAGYSTDTIGTRLETPVVRSYLWLEFKSKEKLSFALGGLCGKGENERGGQQPNQKSD